MKQNPVILGRLNIMGKKAEALLQKAKEHIANKEYDECRRCHDEAKRIMCEMDQMLSNPYPNLQK